MASIRSLGVRTPAALPYLIHEGILPADAPPNAYTWSTYNDDDGEEEVTATEYCVVWSRGGIIRKTFNFEVEGERVLQAVLTWFPSGEANALRNTTQDLRQDHGPGTLFAKDRVREPGYPAHEEAGPGRRSGTDAPPEKLSRALVVFLKTQAHVFFLAGSSHVVNLPFEVERVFPAPRGLLIQRKLSMPDFVPASPAVPRVPPNSFYSQLPTQSFSQNSNLFTPMTNTSFMTPRRARSGQGAAYPASLADLLKAGTSPSADGLPRLFSFTDPFSEMGLVVAAQPQAAKTSWSVKQSGSKSLDPVDRAEEVLYVTKQNEMSDSASPADKPLILVVTVNYEKRYYSVWYASYIEPKPASAKKSRRSSTTLSVGRSRRRSSLHPGTGTTTPALRTREGTRDSFGGPGRGYGNASFTASQTRETSSEHQTAEEAFASQLDPETDLARQPTRESRRVSSLLSRADLSRSFDKSAFEQATHRSSLGSSFGHSRRGPSIGGHGLRTSLGPSSRPASRKMRASTPGDVSQISLSAVSLEDTLDDDLDLDNTIDDSEIPDELLGDGEDVSGLQEPIEGLRRELLLVKFSEFPFGTSESIFHSSVHGNPMEPPKIFTLKAPRSFTDSSLNDGHFFLYMMQKSKGELVEHEFTVQRRRLTPTPASCLSSSKPKEPHNILIPTAVNTRRQRDFIDAVKICDNGIQRVLCLARDDAGDSLSAGWCPQARYTLVLPRRFKLFNPYSIGSNQEVTDDPNRTIATPQDPTALAHAAGNGSIDVKEGNGRHHRLQVKLWPQNAAVSRVLSACRLVLPPPQGDHLLAIWWSISRNLRNEMRFDVEWAALVASIFAFGVGGIDSKSVRLTDFTRSVESTPSRRSLRRATADDPFELLWRYQSQDPAAKSWDGAAWSWVEQTLAEKAKPRTSTRHSLLSPSTNYGIKRKSDFIPFCAKAARDFLQEPLAKKILPETAGRSTRAKHQDSHATYLPSILVALHLLREEEKLNILNRDTRSSETGNLAPVLAQLGRWLDWEFWDWKNTSPYGLDGASLDQWVFEDATIATVSLPTPPWEKPPSIFDWLERMLDPRRYQGFPTLDMLIGQPEKPQTSHDSQSLAGAVTALTPRTVALCKYLAKIRRGEQTASLQVETMVDSGIDTQMLETFPSSVVAGIREAIVECQSSPPTTWNERLLEIVGREDLTTLLRPDAEWSPSPTSLVAAPSVASRDVHTICQSAEANDSSQSSSEADRHMITRLIFSEDRRYIEALRLLEPLRPAVAECIPDPSWTEAEHLDAQKSIMQWVMLRTFALPSGHSMLQFDSKRPLVTEKYPLHGFTTLCTMKPLNNTVSADRSTYTEEKFAWAFFHAGVSAGLSISRRAKGIDTSWIAYNKPAELSNKHAGLLFGLGLNGHLKNIAKWLSFKYLTPKHSMTSIGLLLGLSVSYMGTMDTLVTRLLSVHVTRMLPPGAADLNLPPLAQTTGLMGIGLLYLNSQHRRMSEIMLSEIEHVELEDPSAPSDNIRDEGYRLAAGFALGLINLGNGNDLRGLHDMRLVERLLAVAVGPKPVDIVHVLDQATAGAVIAIALVFMKTQNASVARKINIPDTLPQFDYVRPDIFLLRTLAKHLIMWDDIQADYTWIVANLPPEYGVNHTLTEIKTLRSEHMPFYNIMAGLLWSIGLKHAGTGNTKARDFLVTYLDQFIRLCHLPAIRYDARLTRNTVRNCQDLVALSAATVMAGTGDIVVFRRLRLLHGRVSPDVPYGSHFAAHMALGALFVAGGSYTFSTSKLAVAALVCAFYPLFPTDVLDNKAHLQAFRHFWVLAAEPRCAVTRDVETGRAIAMPLAVTFRDGGRREYAAPCLLPELDTVATIATASPEHWQVTLDFVANPAHLAAFKRTQTIHARRRPYAHAHSSSSHHSSSSLQHHSAAVAIAPTFNATLAALNDAHLASAAVAASSARAGVTGAGSSILWDWIFSLPALRGGEPKQGQQQQQQNQQQAGGDSTNSSSFTATSATFPLPVVSKADVSALVMPMAAAGDAGGVPGWSAVAGAGSSNAVGGYGAGAGGGGGGGGIELLTDGKTSPVDERLVLRTAALRGWDADGLRNLRLLFRWAERAQDEEEVLQGGGGGGGSSAAACRWLGREVVEGLRAVVGERGRAVGGGVV
ncbi:Anaphase-promoting complex subunit 1 [Diplodia seriata]